MAARSSPLLGAAAGLRELGKRPASTDPHYGADYQRAIAVIQVTLDAETLADVQRAARELPLEEIVSEALAALQPTESPEVAALGPNADHLDAFA